jgi:DNA-binding protein HU-beta
MNKNELVAEVAEKASIDKKDAAAAVDATFDAIVNALKGDEEVRITGFGTFWVSHSAERQGRDPRTGKPITIAASKSPKFRPGKPFKDTVNG